MRIVHAGRLFVLCGVFSALLSALPAMAAVDAYMTMKGSRQGSIRNDAMSENIPLVSVVRNTPMAAGMAAGKRMHSSITITKKIDVASPKLAMASSSNEVLSEVAITFEGGTADAKAAQKIVLTNAIIQSIRRAGSNEEITFDYQSIEVTYAKGGKTMMDDWNTPK